jgi:hypothetical protein
LENPFHEQGIQLKNKQKETKQYSLAKFGEQKRKCFKSKPAKFPAAPVGTTMQISSPMLGQH